MLLDRVVDLVFKAVNTFDAAKSRFNEILHKRNMSESARNRAKPPKIKSKIKSKINLMAEEKDPSKKRRGARNAQEIKSERATKITTAIKDHGLSVVGND